MNALVLDDEPRYREHLRRSLERQGLKIHVAANAEEAQQIVRDLGVDVMIVDIKLADSIDGLEFADWARQQDDEAGLIVITGYGSPEHKRRSRDLGALAYLEKPFDLDELKTHVERAVRDRHRAREIQRLQGELANAAHGQLTSHMPVVGLGANGEIRYASAEGRAVLDTLVDPDDSRPIQAVDDDLLGTLQGAANAEPGWQRTTVFRRDGVVAHYEAFVRALDWGDEAGLLVFFQPPAPAPAPNIDELWMGLLLKAANVTKRETGGT